MTKEQRKWNMEFAVNRGKLILALTPQERKNGLIIQAGLGRGLTNEEIKALHK